MNFKKIKIIGVFIIFALCFPLHFLYDWFPNIISSIFLPVNESIWEHMKLIITSFILYSIIETLIIRKKKIKTNNYVLNLFATPLIGIILYLLIFLPIYKIIGENMIISITLLFIIIIIEQIISYFITISKEIKGEKIIGTIGIIIVYIIFTALTYFPIENYIFYDVTTNSYGIN